MSRKGRQVEFRRESEGGAEGPTGQPHPPPAIAMTHWPVDTGATPCRCSLSNPKCPIRQRQGKSEKPRALTAGLASTLCFGV